MSTETEVPAAEAPGCPQMPPPVAQHEWLQQFAGDWESEVEIFFDPAGPPMQTTGREKLRMLGGFWLISESTSDCEKMPYSNIITIGYSPAKGKYIGSCVDSMMAKMWIYEGTVSGNKITLATEGECPDKPGKVRQFSESLELVDQDHKVFKSQIQQDDGTWQTCLVVKATRVK